MKSWLFVVPLTFGTLASSTMAHTPPLPEGFGQHVTYTIEQAAKSSLATFDAAAEAIVEEATPTKIERLGGCTWMTSLRFHLLRPIWGEFTGVTFYVLTSSVPPGFSPSGDCTIGGIPGEPPPPDQGLRGIVLLLGGDDWTIPNALRLSSVRNFLLRDGDSVTVHLPNTVQRFPYEGFVAALQAEAGAHTIAAMSQEATCILLGTSWFVRVARGHR